MKNVFFEPWQTPLMSQQTVGFVGILNTNWLVHFCLSLHRQKEIHVVTIPSGAPYRVFEEAHLAFLDKYFETDMTEEQFSLLGSRFCQTWKLWNTDYIKEMDEGYCISGYGSDYDPKIFQCLIKTQEQWIEFIYPNPIWKVFENSNFETVVNYYLNEDPPKESL
jgi:hypothetical protein